MEEAEAKEKPFVFFNLFALVKIFFVHVFVRPQKIVAQTLRRLQSHLDTVL
jgi:hypothetical protein